MNESLEFVISEIRKAAITEERERCAKLCEPKTPRPCDCDSCYCGNIDDAIACAMWDSDMALANLIRKGE